jgi:LysR family transcriptional regulator, glycine cleavage system transcriptional activator
MEALPSMASLRAFESAARLGSFKDAAEELHVTPAAVSYQIRSLETQIRVTLFHRTAQGLKLTAAGLRYLPVVQSTFSNLKSVTEEVASHDGPQVLTVNALPTFTSSWLIPRIWKFHEQHPNVELRIFSNNILGVPVDFSRNQADLAIRGGVSETDWPHLHAERLVHEEMFPVCSPILMSSEDRISTPEQLINHTLLICTSAPEGWNTWLEEAARRGHDVREVNPGRGLKFDTVQLAMDACALGRGIVIGRRPLVDIYLDTGRLVQPFDFSVTSRIAYWLIGPPKSFDRPCVEAFRSWIMVELNSAS